MTPSSFRVAHPARKWTVWIIRMAAVVCGLAVISLFAWSGLRSFKEDADGAGQLVAGLRAAGKSTAMAAAALLMIQFVMSARLKLLDRAFGLDRLLRFHAVAGATAVCLGALHPFLLYATGYYRLGEPRLELWPEFVGAVLLGMIVLVGFTSLWRTFLNLSYEAWQWIHKLTFVGVAAMSVHALARGSDLRGGWPLWAFIGSLACYAVLFVWVKIVKPLRRARDLYTVLAVRRLSRNVHNVELAAPLRGGFGYLPGQFAFLRLRRAALPTEEHPFTISSSPSHGRTISFTIKESGDYTSKIGRTRPGDTATVDGPYGRFSHLAFREENGLLFIAGGVGITPIMSMIRYMADTGDRRPALLIWSNRTAEDVFFREELAEIVKKMPNLRVHHVLTRQEGDRKSIVDGALLRRLLTEQDLKAHVFLCGPPPMMRSVGAALRQLGFPGKRIHMERFSF